MRTRELVPGSRGHHVGGEELQMGEGGQILVTLQLSVRFAPSLSLLFGSEVDDRTERMRWFMTS
jgi:hypothetical protein